VDIWTTLFGWLIKRVCRGKKDEKPAQNIEVRVEQRAVQQTDQILPQAVSELPQKQAKDALMGILYESCKARASCTR
jgi:hypothetical protein